MLGCWVKLISCKAALCMAIRLLVKFEPMGREGCDITLKQVVLGKAGQGRITSEQDSPEIMMRKAALLACSYHHICRGSLYQHDEQRR